MKKIKILFFGLLAFLTWSCAIAQPLDTSFVPIANDIVNTTVALANATNNTIISGVDNGVTGSIATFLILIVHRIITVAKWRKKGRLRD